MSIYLKNNSIFLHIPKTGGKWVTSVLKKLDLYKFNFSHNHADMERTNNFHRHFPLHFIRQSIKHGYYLPKVRKAFKFCFVRHPLSYYESYYKFAMQLGWPEGENPMGKMPGRNNWHPNSPLFMYKPDNFNEFIKNILDTHPGYVSELYSSYTTGVDYIGKTENLAEDLIEVLELMGLNIDRELVKSHDPVNVSKKPDKEISWNQDLENEVLRTEYPALVRYDYINDCYGAI